MYGVILWFAVILKPLLFNQWDRMTYFYKWKNGKDWGFFFRIKGYGLCASTLAPLYSERSGYVKIIIINGVKFKILKP